jgi:hypothetical protein
MVASVGGLFAATGVGVALLDWASRAIDDVAAALNFFTQNTFSLLLFLAVIVQAVISNKQWRAMKDSVERTDTIIENMQGQLASMEGQERIMQGQLNVMKEQTALIRRQVELAFVSEQACVVLRDWKKPVLEDGVLKVSANFVNRGRTPAWDIKGRSNVGVDRIPRAAEKFPAIPSLEEEALLLDTELSFALAVGDKGWLVFNPPELNTAQTAMLVNGTMNIFIDGIARYFDGLGNKHFYTYGFTLRLGDDGYTPRYERHNYVKADK